jgi:hypothetical protein
MTDIDANTKFSLKDRGYPSTTVLTGKLGTFADCLKDYRDITHRKTTKKGKPKRQELWISEDTFLDIVSLENEVFYFTVDVIESKDRKAKDSKTYAVNCDLSLLDAD